ncbi:MAG: hypothetical protein L6437_16100, partial [Kiritimatiellae bacterium]|nr:hypothetical protein [Kiritimatiellia bacterium]
MNSKRVKSNKSRPALCHSALAWARRRVCSLLGALALLVLIPSAGFAATYNLAYNLDIVTNPPGTSYVAERNRIQSPLSSGAKWGIDSYGSGLTTNNHGYTEPLVQEGWWSINFRTMTNYYVPVSSDINLTNHMTNTYWYVPYSNTLSVTITGTNGVVWSVASASEWINSSAYKPSYTDNFDIVAIPTGSYTITFPLMAVYDTPPPVFTNITAVS